LRFEDTHIEEGYLKVMGKGAKERIVPIGALSQKMLWRYVIHFRPKPVVEADNYLFLTLDSKPLRPNAPSINERIEALEELRLAAIRTFAMIAPMLPKSEELATQLSGKVDYILIDRMNYHYGEWVYKKYGLEGAMNDDFFSLRAKELVSAFNEQGIEYRVLF
jgi:hypothetical protein